MTISPRPVELLAPARNLSIGIAAIDHGADAVYIGPPSHGARHQASNSIDDIRQLCAYAHRFGARVYVTVNTLVYDDEIPAVERLVRELYSAGVDALIVQDMSLLMMDIPPIALHASTQCDIRTPSKARFLQDAGFSQLVLPREMSLSEIRAVREAVSVPIEVFVHGALCVSYSGDCQASYSLCRRSANRGECAQICRLPFDLEDAAGRKLIRGKHLLSLRDMNRSSQLAELLDAGVSSFKIEGRLKDEAYVRNVVAAYSQALDAVIAAQPNLYRRSSMGRSRLTFTPDLAKSFNRGYTSYFLSGPSASIAGIDSPKWTGEEVARLRRQLSPRQLRVVASSPLANGDGLGFFDASGSFVGFRLNRVEGDTLYLASDISVPAGAKIYRNSSREWLDRLSRPSARRTIPVSMHLSSSGSMLVLSVAVCGDPSLSATVTLPFESQQARTPQEDARRSNLAKLGDTDFELETLHDSLGPLFIPASQLASLRRSAVQALSAVIAARHKFDRRRYASPSLALPEDMHLSRHDNIANHLAERFYSALPSAPSDIPRALEVAPAAKGELRVMQTRYCLRRELGACLRTPSASSLPSPLFLTAPGARFRLDFDCARCGMNLIKV